jgi:Na+/H+ antiporter NhaD/arsenite permease-like protein
VPISIQLAIAIGLNPIGLVIAEILASNIGGSATLIGDPPSTIVGSHIGISFVEYLVLIAPVAVVCMLVLILIHRFQFRKVYTSKGKTISPVLLTELTKEAQIENHKTLYKALIVGSVTLILFFVADLFNSMPPSVVALSGAAVLLAWERPDVDDMVKEVDWTTLIFFIGLFIVVAGMEASGTIDWLANQLLILAHGSLTSATILTTWVSGIASGFVDNIPFTVAALPIVDLMTVNIPNPAENYILYWALVLGADFGGNLTYLGSASNIIAIGLLAQAGYRISFGQFMRNSVPTTIATLIIAVIYLLLRFM